MEERKKSIFMNLIIFMVFFGLLKFTLEKYFKVSDRQRPKKWFKSLNTIQIVLWSVEFIWLGLMMAIRYKYLLLKYLKWSMIPSGWLEVTNINPSETGVQLMDMSIIAWMSYLFYDFFRVTTSNKVWGLNGLAFISFSILDCRYMMRNEYHESVMGFRFFVMMVMMLYQGIYFLIGSVIATRKQKIMLWACADVLYFLVLNQYKKNIILDNYDFNMNYMYWLVNAVLEGVMFMVFYHHDYRKYLDNKQKLEEKERPSSLKLD